MPHRSLTLVVTTLLIVSAVGAAATVSTADSSASVELDGPEQLTAGESATVDVVVDAPEGTPVYGAQFTLSASTDVSGSVESGGYLAQGASSVVLVRNVDEETVEFGETRTESDEGVTGEGTLAVVELTVPESTSADELELTFESVKLADPDAESIPASTSGLTLDVVGGDGGSGDETETASGGGGGAAGGGGASTTPASSATSTASSPTATSTPAGETDEDWPSTVSEGVLERYEDTTTVPVIVTLEEESSPSAVAERLRERGATGVTVHTDIDSVRASVTRSTLRSVAATDDVRMVRYDSSGAQQSGEQRGSATQSATATPGDGSTSSTTTDGSVATATTGTGTTATEFPVFASPLVPLVSLLGGVFLWRRHRRRRVDR